MIKTDVVATLVPTASMTEVPTDKPTATQTNALASVKTASLEAAVCVPSTPRAIPAATPVDNDSIMGVAIGIIVLALLGGVFTWLASKKKE